MFDVLFVEYKSEIGPTFLPGAVNACLFGGMMKSVVLFTVLLSLQGFSGTVFAAPDHAAFPQGPDAQLTPGDVCHSPTAYRYPEHVPYCARNVESQLKREIIATYDRERGFSVASMPRGQFKIDHYIPLCMGGSNEKENLWPQHESIYNITDPMEPALCNKMAAGRVSQAKAMEMIRLGKANLSQVSQILKQIEAL